MAEFADALDVVENGRQRAPGHALVEVLGEALQVNVDAVDHAAHVLERPGQEVGSCVDRHLYALRPCKLGGLEDILDGLHGLAVGEGQGAVLVLDHLLDEAFRREGLVVRCLGTGLGEGRALAVLAVQIAAGEPECESLGARQDVEEGPFFHGVGADLAGTGIDHRGVIAVDVLAHAASAALPRLYLAATRAEVADCLLALLHMPVHGPLLRDISHRRNGGPGAEPGKEIGPA